MADGGSVIFKFKGDSADLEKSTGKAESAISTLAKSFTVANIASNAFNQGIRVITENLGSAIARFDTMNNFPKVMENLGFASEDASKAVDVLSDGLEGLPTALDESISSVQRLTATNGDLEKSTKIYLAMNDALLAGGGNAQMQASAMEQLTQAYSKGKFDAIEYRSVLSAMPGQLKQVAEHLGYTSTAIGGDMYEALQKGTLSMDDFMDAIVTLDTKGVNGMASFHDQAISATGGIATSWKNLRTSVVRSLTSVIDSIDDSLKSIGGISGAIKSLGKVISSAISGIGKGINILIKFRKEIVAIGVAIMAWKIGKVVTGVIQSFQKAQVALSLYRLSTNGASIAQGVLNAQLTLGEMAVALFTGKMTLAQVATTLWSKAQAVLNAVMSANPIGAVLVGVVALTAGIVALNKAINAETEEEKKNLQVITEMKNKMNDLKKANEELAQSRKEDISGIQSQFDYTRQLAQELSTLADASGQVQDKDKARVEFILGQLNNALGTEYQLTGNIIQNYRDLQTEIDNLIEKKEAELMLVAYEEEWQSALKQRNDLQKEGARIWEEYGKAVETWATTGREAKRVVEAKDAWNSWRENVSNNIQVIKDNEAAYTAFHAGQFDEVERILTEGAGNYDVAINQMVNSAKEGGYRIPNEISKGIREGTTKGQTASAGLIGAILDKLRAEASSNKFTFIGNGIVNGIMTGMSGGVPRLSQIASNLGNTVLRTLKNKLGIHSPSTLFRDEIGENMALGIGVGFEKGISGVENDINRTMLNMIPDISTTLGDMFDLSPTLNNTATSSSNVTVQVYNNMETDMMGNLINNIKTFSNGSKNDYNYGMA